MKIILLRLLPDGSDGGNFIRLAWTVDSKASSLEVMRQFLDREEPIDQDKINAEKENIENLSEGLKKTEQSQGSLAKEMREVQSRLSTMMSRTRSLR